MHLNLNLTTDEQERLAYLSGQTALASILEETMTAETLIEAMGDASNYLQEADGAWVAEDALSEHLADLQTLSKRIRGENREELQRITEALQAWRDEQAQAGEYAAEQMRKAAEALET